MWRFVAIFVLVGYGLNVRALESKPVLGLDQAVQRLIDSDYIPVEQFFLNNLEGATFTQQARIYLSRLYLETGQYDKAIDYAELAVKHTPSGLNELLLAAEAYCGKAEKVSIFKAIKWAKKCIHHFDQAAILHPENPKALAYASIIHLQAPAIVGGSKKKAEAYLKRLAQHSPAQADFYRLLALDKEGKTEAAITQAKKLAKAEYASLLPRSTQYNVAHYLKNKNESAAAKPVFEQLVMVEPDIENKWEINDSFLQLGEILIEEEESVVRGVALIEQYKTKNNNPNDAHYFWSTWSLAKGYKKLGNMAKYHSLVEQIKSENYKKDKYFAKEFDMNI